MTRTAGRWTWRPWCGVLSSAALVALVPGAGAQTRFAWPTREPTYADYDVEECAAGVQRARAYAAWGARDDTLSPRARQLAPEYPAAVATAKQCTAHLVLAQLPTQAQPTLLRLSLVAGDDTTFMAGVHASVASVPAPAERAARLSDAASLLLDAHPTRLSLADTLAQALDGLGGPASRAASGVYAHIMTSAHDQRDDARAARDLPRALNAVAAYLQFDSVRLRSRPVERAFITIGVAALQGLGTRDRVLSEQGPTAFLDSVRHGLAAQVVANHLHGPDSAGVVQAGLKGGGRPAPPIQTAFWFSRPDTAVTYPRTGMVSLVVFVDERCGAPCYAAYGTLQRLKQRFGERLDLVVVTSTKGYFRELPPLEPTAEAAVLRAYFLDRLELPAALAVTNTPFVVLPQPDRRRIYDQEGGPLWAAYGVKPASPIQARVDAFLVAPSGLVVGQRMVPNDETEVTDLIADLLAYQRGHP